jgi:hypothetical protein
MGYKNTWSMELFLTLFRLCAVGGIGWLWDATERKHSSIKLFLLLIDFCRGSRNIIDSVFLWVFDEWNKDK